MHPGVCMEGTTILSNFTPAMTRGISLHGLYEMEQQPDYIGQMFHEENMDGAYEDHVTWEGPGLPTEHFPMQRVNLDGVRPSYAIRYLARSWTMGTVIAIEDQQDDLYNLIHKFFPMTGGEWGMAYYALKQILGAQFYGLYGFQSGTSVPFSPDGLSFGNTAHPVSKANTANTWANTTSTAADLSYVTASIMRANLWGQPRPNNTQKLLNKLARVMVHPNQELLAKLIFEYSKERFDTANRSKNYNADYNVDVVVNPYFEYSGAAGATSGFGGLTSAAFNSVVGQGQTHYCRWKKRMEMKVYSRFDNSIMADILTCMERFGYGLDDARGLFFLRGL